MCAPNNINSINLQYSMRDPGVPFKGGFSFDEHVLLKLVFLSAEHCSLKIYHVSVWNGNDYTRFCVIASSITHYSLFIRLSKSSLCCFQQVQNTKLLTRSYKSPHVTLILSHLDLFHINFKVQFKISVILGYMLPGELIHLYMTTGSLRSAD